MHHLQEARDQPMESKGKTNIITSVGRLTLLVEETITLKSPSHVQRGNIGVLEGLNSNWEFPLKEMRYLHIGIFADSQ